MVVVGNKCDLVDRAVSLQDGEDFTAVRLAVACVTTMPIAYPGLEKHAWGDARGGVGEDRQER